MFTFSNGSKLVISFSLAAFITGCGSTATITRVGARPIEAKIVNSDARAIFIETNGVQSPVPRDDISDIDHPGNVAATIGTILTGYGIVNIAVGAENCERAGAAYCTGVFLPAAIGAPLMLFGIATWAGSVSNAGAPKDKTESSIAIVPVVSTDKKNEYVGVSATMRF